ncbi:hypothetical protein EJ03DRAFT_335431 [Teratosphaeria nubilosa]|uniref:Mating-type protein MAT-1 n=1 Tax=Teratosphaeria nubilosa TaxID=161662 RepID=A0A6G1LCY8_9PEZI|nr:hypothetical protein EJ03DRAFT_335431 [Teratosphaeria nubilosa]
MDAMATISVTIGDKWRAGSDEVSEEYKRKAVHAKAYSLLRGSREKEDAPLDEFFRFCAPHIGIIPPEQYQELGWQIIPSTSGSGFLGYSRFPSTNTDEDQDRRACPEIQLLLICAGCWREWVTADVKRQHELDQPGYQYQPGESSEKKKHMTKNKLAKLTAKAQENNCLGVSVQQLAQWMFPVIGSDESQRMA